MTAQKKQCKNKWLILWLATIKRTILLINFHGGKVEAHIQIWNLLFHLMYLKTIVGEDLQSTPIPLILKVTPTQNLKRLRTPSLPHLATVADRRVHLVANTVRRLQPSP